MGNYRPEGERIHYQVLGKFLYPLAIPFVAPGSRVAGDPRDDMDETLYQGQEPFAIGSDVDQDGDPLTDAGTLVFEGTTRNETDAEHSQESIEVEWNLRPADCDAAGASDASGMDTSRR